VFLPSDFAKSITGVTIDVTGGTTAGLNYRVGLSGDPTPQDWLLQELTSCPRRSNTFFLTSNSFMQRFGSRKNSGIGECLQRDLA